MKLILHRIIFALLMFLYTSSINAQFVQINSNTNENLNAVYFTSADTGYIAGDNGIILKTVDGGDTWDILTTGFTNKLRAIYFQSNNIGYSNALKTIDGGATWVSFLDSTTHSGDATKITFINDSVGFFSGINDSKVYKTIDRGESWEVTFLNSSMVFQDVVFTTDSIGFLAGWYPGSFWKTIDQGNNWSLITDTMDVYSISFPSVNVGYVVGSKGILKTTDGGNSWFVLSTEGISKIFCTDDVICYAFSNGIIKTINGGISWQQIPINQSNLLNIFFTDANNGIVVGENGLILKTSNGGLGMESINKKKIEINIYPNPFSESTSVSIEGLTHVSNNTIFTLYNVLGEKVRTMPVKSKTFEIQKESLQRGVYFYQINNDSQTIANGKLVIE